YLLIFFSCLYLFFQRAKKEKKELLNFFLFSSLFFAYFLQGMTVFDMPISSLLLFFTFAFISVVFQEGKEERRGEEKRNLSPLFASFVFFLAIFSFFYFIFLPAKSNLAILRCLGEKRLEKISVCQKINISPFGKIHNWETIASLIANEQEEISLAQKRKLEMVKDNLEKTVKKVPLRFRSQFFLARTLRVLAAYDLRYSKAAYKQIEQVIAMNPVHPFAYLELSLWYLQENRIKEAKEAAEKALSLEPRAEVLQKFVSKLKKVD
ncbi:MAG: hypothetical protein ACPLZH_02240, partial [Minisyncoccales bacterium]